ncbi:MAG: histidine ammonia-lyase [Bacteroidetes bacterium HGW-Bacteroidetes-8]|jgi:histidine ammonia-lyase|nr:MAG: histidine ammonia-lyase [Bacteroidetes bacterium HGW-Bacteroidetes-8]
MEYFHISSHNNTIDEVRLLLDPNCKIVLSQQARERILKSREYLDNQMLKAKEPIYGINTGFGSLCNVKVDSDQLSQLQVNLVMSHACGLGEEVPEDIVKLMMALKIKSLSYGYSGVRIETVERLADMFNNRVYPVVYKQGSLGASGDLAPLANMSLPLIDLGEVNYQGRRYPSVEINKKFNWEPLKLASKEGLALLNGTQFMLAYSVWSIIKARKLSQLSDTIAALSLDAYDGRVEPFTEAVHLVRPHKGQLETAAKMRELLKGSELISRDKLHVQDPYSFRCVPQVHGASKDTINYALNAFETELNSATDNPTILPDEDKIISAGNFHGQPLALPLDFLSIALAELGSISERRTYQLISGKRGLPSFLVAHPGLNSGFMIPQYAQASVVSQNKQLATPACIDTIDSSQGQEDHVSMGANAATKCYQVVENLEKILAIELMNAAQALEFRRPLKSSPILEEFVSKYRRVVPFVKEDEVMYIHINNSISFLRDVEI